MAIRGGLRAGELGVTLIVRDVKVAAEFYRVVLGAEEIRRHGPEETLDAVEMRLGDANLIVTRENPRWREAPRPDWPRSPASAGAATSFFTVYVADVDVVFARAIAMGASPQTRARGPRTLIGATASRSSTIRPAMSGASRRGSRMSSPTICRRASPR